MAACSKAPDQAAAPPPPAVTVATPTARTVTDWDEFVGRFEAIQQVQIRARVGGFVDSVDFKDGTIVKTGDLLYVIDPRPYTATLLQAQGQLADAKAKVDLAERELARAMELVRTSAVSEAVVDQRRQQSQAAQAAVLQAEGALKRAELDVSFTNVTAPIAGRVSRHLVSVGNLVQGAEAAGPQFSPRSCRWIRSISISTWMKRPTSRTTVCGTRADGRARATRPIRCRSCCPARPSRRAKAAMDFVDNRLDVATGTLRGRAVVPNTDLSILPGQFARIRVIGSAPYEALLLPDTAITNDQSRKVVFVVNKDDVVEMRPVTLGPLDDGLRVVREGLKKDDRVVVDGLQRARVGAKVTPQAAKGN